MITIYVDDPTRIDLHVHSVDGETEPVVLRSLGSPPALDPPPRAERSASAPRRVGLLTAAALVAAAGVGGYVVAPRGQAAAPMGALAAALRAALTPLPAPRPPRDPLLSVQRELALQRALASRPTVTPPAAAAAAPPATAAPTAPAAPVAPPGANPFGLHR